MSLSKGEQSRQAIIDAAREIYNKYGLELRIKDLAKKWGLIKVKLQTIFILKS